MKTNAMTYKGYTALVAYSAEDECLVGHVVGIRDLISFHGDSVAEARAHFHDVLDNYLEMCRRMQLPPEKPRSGKLMLRLPPELHALAARRSEESGASLNQVVVEVLEAAFRPASAPRQKPKRGAASLSR